VSGTFGRMLYFSAIVITTVGFGVIVPITSLARTAVGHEAIVGIILAGLFLNAIAYGAEEARVESRPHLSFEYPAHPRDAKNAPTRNLIRSLEVPHRPMICRSQYQRHSP
jgi:Ion channel